MDITPFNQEREFEKIIKAYKKNPKQSIYTKIEISVLCHYYGIGCETLKNKAEVGKTMGYSRTRIYQIFESIEKKMELEAKAISFEEMMKSDKYDERSVLEVVNLKLRTRNGLWKNGITTVSKFKRYLNGSYKSDLHLRNIGKTSQKEIQELKKTYEVINV